MEPENPSQPPSQQPPPGYPPPGYPQQAQPVSAVDPKVKNLSIALGVLALLVLVAIFTHAWFTMSERGMDGGMGLTGVEVCGRGRCASVSWGDMGGKAPGGIEIFGYAGLLGGLAIAGLSAAWAFFGFTGKPNPIPFKVLNAAAGVAAFGMVGFVVRWFAEGTKGASIGYSAFLGIGGVIGIGVIAKMLTQPQK